MTAGSKAGQILSVPLESIGTAMTTYTGQNLGAGSLPRVRQGVRTALGIGCVYSVASFVILHFVDTLLIGMFLDSSQDAGGVIMANAREFLFWNSVFYIPLAVLIVYRYSIQGLGYSGLAMFAGVAEMFARAMVGFAMVPVFGYWAGCIASPGGLAVRLCFPAARLPFCDGPAGASRCRRHGAAAQSLTL